MPQSKEDLAQIKAIDLNTESLKLYITISVAALAGLITFHNSSNYQHNELFFYISIILFFICAIVSVVTINSHITYFGSGKLDLKNKRSSIFNLLAIGLFFLGIFSSCLYFYNCDNQYNKRMNDSGITIRNNDIYIGGKVEFQVKITKDSLGNIREVKIEK